MNLAYKTVIINLIKNPRKAFYAINQFELFKYKLPLLLIAGITNTVGRKFFELADTNKNLFSELISLFIAGAIVGWIGILLFSGLFYLTGKWIKGIASFNDIINIAAYASIPAVLMLISTIISIILLRILGFEQTDYNNYVQRWNNIYYAIIQTHTYLNILLNLYYFILLIIGISVVQGFSIGKALLNFLLVILLAVVFLSPVLLIPVLINHLRT